MFCAAPLHPQIQSEINMDDVHKLTDDTAEAKAYQQEINAALGEQLSTEDEEPVMVEFENLEAQLEPEPFPDALVTAVQPVEKTKAQMDTEASTEDIDKVIEPPDVPTKAYERPEISEISKGTKFILTLFNLTIFNFHIYCYVLSIFLNSNSYGRATTSIVVELMVPC